MPTPRPRPQTKAQQRADTTRTLIATARTLFAAKGYAHVSLAEIVDAAGVTKGALYHYFTGKDALFHAVLREVHAEVAEHIAAAAREADPWTRLVTGCRTFLTTTAEPGIQRIMLLDAPAVLGWESWRELDAATSMQGLVGILNLLVADGIIVDQPVDPLSHLLSGAMNEAAIWLARSSDPATDLENTVAALTRMLGSLRAPTLPAARH